MVMSASVEVKGIDEVVKNLKGISAAHAKEAEGLPRKAAMRAKATIGKRYSRGGIIKPRSGNLRSSVQARPLRGAHGWEVGTTVKYAKTHERGATIRPSHRGGRMIITGRTAAGQLKSKMSKGTKLAIPVGKGRANDKRNDKRKVARGQYIDRTALDLSRGRPFSTWVNSRGTLMMSIQKARSSEFFALAVLRDRVKIRKRPVWGPVTRQMGKWVLAAGKRLSGASLKKGGA